MIRAGGWRDLGLMRRLTPLGACLHSEASLTTGARVLQKGLVGLFVDRRGASTLVWHGDGDGDSAFAQMHLEDTTQRARVYFLAPTGAQARLRPTGALLDGLVREAGACGARNLTAEAQDGTAEFEALRRAGFVIYARQQVFRLITRPPAVKTDITIQRCGSQDEIATQRLYSNIVPAVVRQVEPAPTGTDGGYLLRHEDEVVALLCVNRGRKGTWVQPCVHPEAEGAIGEVLAAFLLEEKRGAHKPLYVCVRSYHSWLGGALQDAGFEPWEQQTVMVKRLTVSARKPRRKPIPAIAVTEVDFSAPVAKKSLMKATTPSPKGR